MCENELEEVPISDLVVTVRQISNYPNLPAASGSESVLVQQGGVGGPYAAISTQALVQTALNAAGTLGVGYTVPSNAQPGNLFASPLVLENGTNLRWNGYYATDEFIHYVTSGAAAQLGFDGSLFSLDVAAPGSAGAPVTAFSPLMQLSMAGAMSLPFGTLTVARDPAAAFEVATLNWVSNNTVASFNARKGQVQLTAADVYAALQLCDPIATQPWVSQAIQAAIQNLLTTCPFVNRWNGRTGSVYLMLSDITTVFFQPGQQPISPTPPPTSDDNSIATTAWVTEYVTNLGIDGQGLATEAWVLANTVNSFNGRTGVVTLTAADVVDVGGAPLNSPAFSGIPTAPTAAQGQATGQIATTAFVQQAIAHNTAGVSTFNTRAGDVVLTTNDVTTAGGLTNPSANLTGAPTAPTAAPGTSTPQIANTQFVTTALAGQVQSFNTRTGAVVLTTADITGAGGAPLVSPNFSSVPTAPTASPGTNTVQLATCAFVQAAVSAAGGVSSFNGRTGAVDLIGNDISAAGGLVNPSVNLTGTPTAPTATAGTNTSQIATTAFVVASLSTGLVQSFNTRTGVVTLTGADISTAGGALLASPNFTGAPTAPTAPANTNNTQLATTQFVMAAILADTTGVTSFNTRTGAITLTTADVTSAGGAPIASPAFTGVPVGPTAAPGTNTTQLATTSFVAAAIAGSGVSSFNTRTGAVTLIANDISAAGGAVLASPVFIGTPAAPTATLGTNTTQLATCAFVAAAIAAINLGVISFNTRQGAVTLTTADITGAGGAPLASPAFTGAPSLPTGTTGVTQTAGNSSTALATTAFVATSFAPLASPTFTGTPNLPTGSTGVTQTAGTSNTTLATTQFVAQAVTAAPAVAPNLANNTAFAINQRGYASGTALASGAFGHDRWKGGASGGTYTYTPTTLDTTITITAGSIMQVVEGNQTNATAFVLSWVGTANARINAGAYGASPRTVTGIAVGANVTIEFNAGTVSHVKFEAGSTPTQWQALLPTQEILNCQRYYFVSPGQSFMAYAGGSGQNIYGSIIFPASMRATPTINQSYGTGTNVSSAGTTNVSVQGFQTYVTSGGVGAFSIFANPATASADL